MSTLQFTRVELKNWKNFPKVDAKLARRVFVVGPNAIGKSNFLQAFRFLRDLALDGGGLAAAVNERGGIGKLRSLYARANQEIMLRVEVRDENGVGWDYELAFTHDSVKRPRPKVLREVVHGISDEGKKLPILQRPDLLDKKDPERLTQTALQQVQANRDFRGLADFFRTISYLHLVPQLLREEQPSRPDLLGTDPFGRDLLDQIRNTTLRSQKARLSRIEKVLKAVTPHLDNLKLTIDSHGRPHLEGKFQHWRPNGAYQDERQLSDGTLRLIGLLWALQEPGGPLLLEEPELSLHAAIVRRLAPFIHRAQTASRGRQVLLTTHSEHLLMDQGISAEEILLAEPSEEGSRITVGSERQDILGLMMAGLVAGEAVLPRTENRQMALFGRLEA